MHGGEKDWMESPKGALRHLEARVEELEKAIKNHWKFNYKVETKPEHMDPADLELYSHIFPELDEALWNLGETEFQDEEDE